MDLVIDANVLFSALIKDSFAYNLLFSGSFHLFTPEYIFIELEKHQEEILKKSERTDEEFFRILEILKQRIVIIPLEELVPYVKEAEKFNCRVEMEKNGIRVNAKSIMGILMLAAPLGSDIKIVTEGPDEEPCMKILVELVNNKFCEES